jgi:hypothetical protein
LVVRNEDLWVAHDLDLKAPASIKKPAVRKSRAK